MKESVGRHLEEAFSDSRNWKGVADFVRVGMVGLLDLFRINGSAIRELEKELHGKAGKNETASQLAGKLSMSEFAQLHERYSTDRALANGLSRVELELKARLQDISTEVRSCRNSSQLIENQQLEAQSRLKELEEQRDRYVMDTNRRLEEILLRKADRTEIDGLCRLNQTFECELKQLQQSVVDISSRKLQHRIQDLAKQLNQQEQVIQISSSSQETFRTRIQSTLRCLQEELTSVSCGKTKLAEELVSILNRQDEQKRLELQNTQREAAKQRQNVEHLTNRSASFMKQLEGVASRLETLELRENNFNKLRLECGKEFARMAELEQAIEEIQEKVDHPPESEDSTTKILEALTQTFDDELEKKIRILRQVLESKITGAESRLVTKSELHQSLSGKLNQEQLEVSLRNFLEKVGEIDGQHNRLMNKLDRLHEEFINFKLNESRLNESFTQAIDTRVTSEHLQQAIVDMVSYSDLKLVVGELTKKLQCCADKDRFQRFAQDQSTINQTLCSENIVARWVWNGQPLRNGNLVPWEKQVINTLPENFLWQENSTTVTIGNGGLYQLEMGFYCRKKPTVQVIVNGIAVLSAINSNSYVVHHSSGKLKQHRSKEHPVGGLTLVDYFLVPARARLAVSYTGEELGEGFVSLRRL